MFMSAKAFFDDKTPHNNRLLIRAQTEIPQEFVRLFKKNVVNITPKKTGALRRSIITQALGNKASISWRMPYAAAQHEGGHTDKSTHFAPTGPPKGKGYMARPGYSHRYKNYTTPGTGPRFGSIAYKATQAQMPPALRQMGLTK